MSVKRENKKALEETIVQVHQDESTSTERLVPLNVKIENIQESDSSSDSDSSQDDDDFRPFNQERRFPSPSPPREETEQLDNDDEHLNVDVQQSEGRFDWNDFDERLLEEPLYPVENFGASAVDDAAVLNAESSATSTSAFVAVDEALISSAVAEDVDTTFPPQFLHVKLEERQTSSSSATLGHVGTSMDETISHEGISPQTGHKTNILSKQKISRE
jgi:hypothetical protein